MKLIVPSDYKPKLIPETAEVAIQMIREKFQAELSSSMNLRKVSSPLFLSVESALYDSAPDGDTNLTFTTGDKNRVALVSSLDKWKQRKLADFEIAPGYGIYTDFTTVDRSAEPGNLKSYIVDLWDWEKIVEPAGGDVAENVVEAAGSIYRVVLATEKMIGDLFVHIDSRLPAALIQIEFEDGLPDSDNAVIASECKDKGAILAVDRKAGQADVYVWSAIINCPIKLYCVKAGAAVEGDACLSAAYPTVGGWIDKNLLAMYLLCMAHIGETHSSVWPAEHISALRQANVVIDRY